ncbi:hypothetical protein ACF1BQ_029695 [Bradyrhizobium sp. RDT10]
MTQRISEFGFQEFLCALAAYAAANACFVPSVTLVPALQLSLRPAWPIWSASSADGASPRPVPLTRPADVVNASAALVFSLANQVGDLHVASTADLLGLVAAVLAGSGVTLTIVLVAAAPKVSRRVVRAPRRTYIS